jgi:hypothetical protein
MGLMRRSMAALVALPVLCLSLGSQACDCPDRARVVRHRTVVHHWHRRVVHAYAPCPIALAYDIRPGCNTYYRTYIGLR